MDWGLAAGGAAFFEISFTTVFGEKADEVVHRCEIGGTEDETALMARSDQLRVVQLLQVEGQSRWRNAQLLAYPADRQTLRPTLDQQSEDGKPGLLG